MNLLQTVQTSYEPGTYVMSGCLCNGGLSIALSLSTQTIRIYDTQGAAFLCDLKDHTHPISDLAATPAMPSILYSSQTNCGVMVSDLRQAKAVHFITDMCDSGVECSSIAVSPSATTLAISADRNIHLVDTRTWVSQKCIEELHVDEVSRVRFLDDQLLCSAGEDQMINFIDVRDAVADDDVVVQALNCGEVITRMNCFAEVGLVAMIGSCENGYVCPYNVEQKEVKYERPGFDTYLVDWCLISGQLHLISGLRDEEGNAGPLQVLNWESKQTQLLPKVHKEIGRVAMGFGDRLITGGEDGMLVYWKNGELSPSEVATSAGSSSRRTGWGKTTARTTLSDGGVGSGGRDAYKGSAQQGRGAMPGRRGGRKPY